MPRTPKISILLPAFCARGTLRAGLESVRRQSEGSWECVLVDDGSTDGTAELAREMTRRDPRFRVIETPRRGLVAALNTGLHACRAANVARMDADDLMHGERLRDQLAALDAAPDLAAVGCHVRLFPRRGLGPGYRAYEAWLNAIDSPETLRREAFVECPVAHPGLMFRRERLERYGYRDRGWPEDYDLVLRMLAGGERIGVVPRRRLLWRHADDRLSRRSPVYARDRFTACKASFLAGSFLAATERYILWGHGATGRALRRELARLGRRAAQIVELHPGRLSNRIDGAAVVPPEALPGLERLPLVVSVAGHGPRRRIRAALAGWGFRELVDFVCAA